MESLNFIGGGNMARALIAGLVATGEKTNIFVADQNSLVRSTLEKDMGVETVGRSADLPASEATLLAVKPFHLREAVEGWDPAGALVISVVAGARASTLSSLLGGHERIVRTMPNTPALFGMGMTGLYAADCVDAEDRIKVESLFKGVGKILWVGTEPELDAVTALSGSGPAYVFRFIEALETAAAELGFEGDDAKNIALQTVVGAAHMAAGAGKTPAELREQVTSRNGTAEAALKVLDSKGFAGLVLKAAQAAKNRSEEIAEETERG